MATTTPLGFIVPDGNDRARDGDNQIAANARKAQDLIAESRARTANLEKAAGFSGDPLALNDAAVAQAVAAGATTKAQLSLTYLDQNTAAQEYSSKYSATQQASDAERMLAIVKGTGTKCFVRNTGTAYEVGYQTDEVRYIVHSLTTFASAPGGYTNLYQLANVYVRRPVAGYDQTAPEVTLTGTWTTAALAGTYGGSYSHSVTAGNTATFITPPGTDTAYLISSMLSNAGAAKVTITDSMGVNVVADALPTTQQEVDAGNLPSTVLTANGGTLAPADRVLNLYAATAAYTDVNKALANTLNRDRSHTITVTVTGYKHASSSAARVYVSGFGFAGPSATSRPERAWSWLQDVQLGIASGLSAYEYAVFTKHGGSAETIGNVHGYDNQTSLTFTIDGVDTVIASGATAAGKTVTIVRTSELFHPKATGKVCDATVRYEVTAPDGLRVQSKLSWLQSGTSMFGMQVMWPYTGTWTKGAFAGQTRDLSIADANLSEKGHVEAYTYAAWSATGEYAGVCSWDAETVKAFDYSPVSKAYVQDRDANMKKLYVPWNFAGTGGDPEYTYAAGEVWTKRCLYRMARVPGVGKILGRL